MALINCPKCDKKISDTADKCIGCGHSLKLKVRKDSISIKKAIKNEELDNTPIVPINNPVNQENYVLRNTLLLFIALGVWGMFMQNMGLFVPSDDYTQKVRVVNTVDTEVQGSVNVNGQVGVYNTVDINIEQINGQGDVFYKRDGRYFLLPTYNPY
ncbi:zinc ribbon domain-containing protein [Flavobacteriales bacterium]|nr:zinc ribbon domain-containing protein [Flavobacteriales bacterium]MDC3390468.1 zinc ribbon domain-containing protein [Flavobacteriales bacterium]